VTAVDPMSRRGVLVWYVHDHYLTCLSELRWRRDVGSCPQRLGEGCLAAIGESRCVLRHPDRALGHDDLRDRIALSRSMAHADGIVVISEYMRSLLIDAAPDLAERIHVVTRPVRPAGTSPVRRRKGPADPAVITFAGRITPEKGLIVIIEALRTMRANGPIELRIAGVVEHPEYWSRCERVARDATAADPRLTVANLGRLDYAATDELLRQSDIVTVPSQWPEPLGAIAIEAMAAGAAVVASNIGGLGTALVHGHNGLLVEPAGSIDSWASALGSLLDRPDRARQLGAQARRDVADMTAATHVQALGRIVARTAVRARW
jgi:glycosyltransferase involved in cell wall biosynthesis